MKKSIIPLSKRKLWRRFIGVGLVVLGLMALDLTYLFSKQNIIVAGAEVGSISVGNLSQLQAKAKLTKAAEQIKSIPVVVGQASPVELTLSGLGITYDIDASINEVFQYGHTGSWWQQWWQRQWALVSRPNFEVQLKYDEPQLHQVLQEKLYSLFETDAKEISLAIRQGKVTVVPGVSGAMLNHEVFEQQLLNNIRRFDNSEINQQLTDFSPTFTVDEAVFAQKQAENMIALPLTLTYDDQKITVPVEVLADWIKTTTVQPGEVDYENAVKAGQVGRQLLIATVNRDKVLTYLRALASDQIDKGAANARVQFKDDKLTVLQESKKGYHLQPEASVDLIKAALWQLSLGDTVTSVALSVEIIEPSINDQKLADLGITELIGRAETNYSTSPANRKHNIALGAAKVNGTILQPGDEFSLVDTLGEVNATTGYLPELVISNNKLERQYGGGLCQPTTTLFRAILDAGLPITSRTNHSRRVSYYEKPSTVKGVNLNWDSSLANIGSALVGYDATVFIPEPDLKFVNDTPHAILIQAFVQNNSSVTFEIYGTSDGRVPSISKAVIDYIKAPPDPQFEPDPSKQSMTMELVEHSVPGAKTHFDYTVKYSDGRENKQTFESFYRPIPEHYLVGTAEPAI